MGVQSVEILLMKHKAAMTDKERWRHLYRDAYRYSQPARDLVDNPQQGQRRFDVVFDSTAVKSAAKAANRLQDLLFPTGKHIVEPQPGPLFNQQDEAVRQRVAEQLQEANERWHASLWRSNFQSVINEGLQDMLIGTLSMLFNEGPSWDPFTFTAVPQFMIGFTEGPWGTIGEVSREVKLHPKVAKQQWASADIDLRNVPEPSEGDAGKRTYVEITYPDEETMRTAPNQTAAAPVKWYYVVIDETEKRKIFDDVEIPAASPWIVGRWAKSAEEIRGRGPILQALPDIRTANKAVELILKNASLAVTGIWTVIDDGTFNPNTARFQAGSFIPVASNGGSAGPSIAPLQFPGNFDIGQLVLADLREQIKEALFDNNLPPVAGPPRTATEFVERLRNLTVDIGPAAGRVQKEIIEPLYLRGLHILRSKNLINIPQELQLDSQTITLNVVNPLSRRQSLDNIERVVQGMEIGASLAGPEFLQLAIKTEDIIPWIWDQLGAPADLKRNTAERQRVLATAESIVNRLQANGAANGAGARPDAQS